MEARHPPSSCTSCGNGDSLISYTINSQNGECTVTCQTSVGRSEAFSGAIATTAIAITSGLVGWALGYIRNNQGGNRRFDSYGKRSGIDLEHLWSSYQKIQWDDVSDDHPYILAASDHTLVLASNGTLAQQYESLWPSGLSMLNAKAFAKPLTWSEAQNVLTSEGNSKRADSRGVTAIEWEWTLYNYNGHNGKSDPTFAEQDMRNLLQSTANRYRDQKHKVLCSCGIDTAYGGQAFKLTMAGSFGNGKFQSYNCGSCADGSAIPDGR